MHSFLVSRLPQTFPSGPDVLILTPDNSLGIEEVRRLQNFLSRKPLMLPQNYAVIDQAEKLTLPAQQALLKTLEEPPGNSQIYLVTSQPESLLPTILSRVQSTADIGHRLSISQEDLEKIQKLFSQLLSSSTSQRLDLIDSQNFTRDSALEFLNHLEFLLHSNLDLDLDYKLISQCRKYLKANVSVRLAMDNFAISLT